jgi:lipoyl(octanoyl) transferase
MQPILRFLGQQPYEEVFKAMQAFALNRNPLTTDELWIVEHSPVYTLGLNGKQEHLLDPGNIPVIRTDRGGQVTYHGPGQLILYALIDTKHHSMAARQMVTLLEQAIIQTLSQYGISACAKPEAPGVYIDDKKIGSIGLRIKNNCSYHGLSLNNRMDLSPFTRINPCGYAGLTVTQLADFGVDITTQELAIPVAHFISEALTS